jgi:hypothetical protein
MDRDTLAASINEMITGDFSGLVNLLYRFDIDEKKLRELLRSNSDVDAGYIIADLLIEREKQKEKSREEQKNKPKNIDDEEKW